jgi:hypothetical protein
MSKDPPPEVRPVHQSVGRFELFSKVVDGES